MNCREFDLLVLDLARNELLETTTRAQGLQHAEMCVTCAARLAEERVLLSNVRLVVTALAQQEVPAQIEAKLLAALSAQAESQPLAPTPLFEDVRWWSWQFAAAAVVVLLCIGLIVGVWRNTNQPESTSQARQLREQPSPSAPISVAKAETKTVRNLPESKPAPALVSRVRPPRRGHQPRVPQREEAMLFYSLVEDSAVAPLESGRVVRVEVPASTFISFGVPVAAEAMTQSVQADLLLGQDGLARAIRFVPASQNTKTQ